MIKNNKFNFYFFHDSYIYLKIKGVGENSILGNTTKSNIAYLKEVYINGKKQDKIDYWYFFNQTDNFVELSWDDNIQKCIHMFDGCTNITEINLSNFNTTQVTLMDYMFCNCSSLISFTLSFFNTSQVKSMSSMFYNCSSLTSLNLLFLIHHESLL